MMMSLEDCAGQMDEELSSKVGGVRIRMLGSWLTFSEAAIADKEQQSKQHHEDF